MPVLREAIQFQDALPSLTLSLHQTEQTNLKLDGPK